MLYTSKVSILSTKIFGYIGWSQLQSAIGVKALDDMIAIPIYLGLAIVQVGTCKVDEQRHCCSGIYLKATTQCRLVDREVRETQCVWLASGLDLSRTRRRFVTTCSDLSDNKLRFVIAFSTCLSLLTGSVLVCQCHFTASTGLRECDIFFTKLSIGTKDDNAWWSAWMRQHPLYVRCVSRPTFFLSDLSYHYERSAIFV